MRIYHVQGLFAPEHGGPTYSLRNYCLGQARAGHDVSAWVLEGLSNSSPVQSMPAPINTHVFRVGEPGMLGRSHSMSRHLAISPDPDVFHLHGTWLRAMYYGALQARRRKIPYILETMGMYEPYGLRIKWLRKRIARTWFQDEILHNAACLHVGSEQEGAQLRALGFARPLAVIPVGVNVDAIFKAEKIAAPWPQIEGKRFFLFLARMQEKKGVEILLKAWAQLAEAFPEYILVLGGSGDPIYEAKCRQLLSDLKLYDRCLWVGRMTEDEKEWAYSNASLYVLPSYSENFGNSVAEALAHGTPVITTDTTPWAGLVPRGCGWIISPELSQLISILNTVLRLSPDELQAMGERGRLWARESLSLGATLTAIESVYNWVACNGPKPACVST